MATEAASVKACQTARGYAGLVGSRPIGSSKTGTYGHKTCCSTSTKTNQEGSTSVRAEVREKLFRVQVAKPYIFSLQALSSIVWLATVSGCNQIRDKISCLQGR